MDRWPLIAADARERATQKINKILCFSLSLYQLAVRVRKFVLVVQPKLPRILLIRVEVRWPGAS
jgi:hypothetical protein